MQESSIKVNNLNRDYQSLEYTDWEERDQALNTAFSHLTDTSDRLMKEDAVIYNLESTSR